MEVPPNETPEAVKSVFDNAMEFLMTYGWTVLFFVVVLNLLWSHFYPKFRAWKERQEDSEKEAEYKKDPSLILEREEAMARARQRMQEEHERVSNEKMERIKEREEKKKQEKLAAAEKLLRGNPKPGSSNQNQGQTLRPEYNPLMGGGGSDFRGPSRRTNRGG